jgi:hypothetical protein
LLNYTPSAFSVYRFGPPAPSITYHTVTFQVVGGSFADAYTGTLPADMSWDAGNKRLTIANVPGGTTLSALFSGVNMPSALSAAPLGSYSWSASPGALTSGTTPVPDGTQPVTADLSFTLSYERVTLSFKAKNGDFAADYSALATQATLPSGETASWNAAQKTLIISAFKGRTLSELATGFGVAIPPAATSGNYSSAWAASPAASSGAGTPYLSGGSPSASLAMEEDVAYELAYTVELVFTVVGGELNAASVAGWTQGTDALGNKTYTLSGVDRGKLLGALSTLPSAGDARNHTWACGQGAAYLGAGGPEPAAAADQNLRFTLSYLVKVRFGVNGGDFAGYGSGGAAYAGTESYSGKAYQYIEQEVAFGTPWSSITVPAAAAKSGYRSRWRLAAQASGLAGTPSGNAGSLPVTEDAVYLLDFTKQGVLGGGAGLDSGSTVISGTQPLQKPGAAASLRPLTNGVPKTGDEASAMVWAAVLALSAIALYGLARKLQRAL